MTPRYELLHVKPSLPERLSKLIDLAFNLRWVWHPDTAAVFERLDRKLWSSTRHNPIKMLGSLRQERLEWAAEDPVFLSHMDRAHDELQELIKGSAWYQRYHRDLNATRFAYFSAEFGITECLPLYSGGLGVLAGDHLKSASELGVPLVGVGLAYKVGYFNQYLNADGWQQEAYSENDFHNMPLELERKPDGSPVLVDLTVGPRQVQLQIWRAQVGRVPLYLLDSNLAENHPEDRRITHQLYGGDAETRIQHEIVLGIGGLRALEALGRDPDVCHINEGHAAFLVIERVRHMMRDRGLSFDEARQVVSASSIFTTHTPVPAGFDIFSRELMERYIGPFAHELGVPLESILTLGAAWDAAEPAEFNMALFAMRTTAFRNGVSRLHGRVSRRMWESEWEGLPDNEIPVASVTNGIHTRTWISHEMRTLLNRYLGPGWSDNPADQREWERVDQIPDEELWRTHLASKDRLVKFSRDRLQRQLRRRGGDVSEITEMGQVLDAERLTIGFARRFASYKRATLLFHDLERLKRIVNNPQRPVQFVFAGKAHPKDNAGKELIKGIIHAARDPELRHAFVFLENYDMFVARRLVQGCDVWLNTPRRPHEASGTSGMKAAANGVLNLSIIDGWWAEACSTDVGWGIGSGEEYAEGDEALQDTIEANALYDILERRVVPLYYQQRNGLPKAWISRMKSCLRNLAPVYNTNRMVSEYVDRFYVPAAHRVRTFLGDDPDRVRNLVRWSAWVREHWNEVVVHDVERGGNGEHTVGEVVPVQVTVSLGELKPEDVSVELYHGQTNAEREVEHGAVTPLAHAGDDGNGRHTFGGELRCGESGLYGFAVRVRPAHPDALVPHELALIRWY